MVKLFPDITFDYIKKYLPKGHVIAGLTEERAKQAEERLAMCNDCDRYRKSIKQCKECWCFMPLKVLEVNVKCPLGKW
tara:strand:+ start:187 stop:420 length:234 start_codon:yes stop_codon:yes gene_type:complete